MVCHFSFLYILHKIIHWFWHGLSFLFPLHPTQNHTWSWQGLSFLFLLIESHVSDEVCHFSFLYIHHTIIPWFWHSLLFLFPLHPTHSHAFILTKSVISLSSTSFTQSNLDFDKICHFSFFYPFTLSSLESDKVCNSFFLYILHIITPWSWQGLSFLFPLHLTHTIPYNWFWHSLSFLFRIHPTQNRTLILTKSVISLSSISYAQSYIDADKVCHFSFLYIQHTHSLILTNSVISISSASYTQILTKSVISLSSTLYTQSYLDADKVCHFSFLCILHTNPDKVCHFSFLYILYTIIP